MQIPYISEPYKLTVGAFAQMIRKPSGNGPCLSSKVGLIILKLRNDKHGPRRLLVGPDAAEYAEKMVDASPGYIRQAVAGSQYVLA